MKKLKVSAYVGGVLTSALAVIVSCSHTNPVALQNFKLPFRTVANDPSALAGAKDATFFLPRRVSLEEELSYVRVFSASPDLADGFIDLSFMQADGVKCQTSTEEFDLSASNKDLSFLIEKGRDYDIECATTSLLSNEVIEDRLTVKMNARANSVEWLEVDGEKKITYGKMPIDVKYQELAKTYENIKNGVIDQQDFALLDESYLAMLTELVVSGNWFYRSAGFRVSALDLSKKEKNAKKKESYRRENKWTIASDRQTNVIELKPGEALFLAGFYGEHAIKLRKKMGTTIASGNGELPQVKEFYKHIETIKTAEANVEAATSDKQRKKAQKALDAAKKKQEKFHNGFAFPGEVPFTLICGRETLYATIEILYRGSAPKSVIVSPEEQGSTIVCQMNDIARTNPKSKNHYADNQGKFSMQYQLISFAKIKKDLEDLLSQKDSIREEIAARKNERLAKGLGNMVADLVGRNLADSRERIEAARISYDLELKMKERRIEELNKDLEKLAATEAELESLKNELADTHAKLTKIEKQKATSDSELLQKQNKVQELEKKILQLESKIKDIQSKVKREGLVTPKALEEGNKAFPVNRELEGVVVAFSYEVIPAFQNYKTILETGELFFSKNMMITLATPIYAYSFKQLAKDERPFYHYGQPSEKRFERALRMNTSILTRSRSAKNSVEYGKIVEREKGDRFTFIACHDNGRDIEFINSVIEQTTKNKTETYEDLVSKLGQVTQKSLDTCLKSFQAMPSLRSTLPRNVLKVTRKNFRFLFDVKTVNRPLKNGLTANVLYFEGLSVSGCYEGEAAYGGDIIYQCSDYPRNLFHPFYEYKVTTNLTTPKDAPNRAILEQEGFVPVWLMPETLSFPLTLSTSEWLKGSEKIESLGIDFYKTDSKL